MPCSKEVSMVTPDDFQKMMKELLSPLGFKEASAKEEETSEDEGINIHVMTFPPKQEEDS